MAVTFTPYNHTLKLLANKEVTFTTLNCMLLADAATFTAADTSIDDVAGAASPHRANEVYGNGWTEGGETLASVAVTVSGTNGAKLDADDISVTATGGQIGNAYKAVVYDTTTGYALAFCDFGEAWRAGETTPFVVNWSSSGIITWAVA
jgi:hypothetical protein